MIMFLMNTFLFFRYGNRTLIFFLLLFSERVQILKTEYKFQVSKFPYEFMWSFNNFYHQKVVLKKEERLYIR